MKEQELANHLTENPIDYECEILTTNFSHEEINSTDREIWEGIY